MENSRPPPGFQYPRQGTSSLVTGRIKANQPKPWPRFTYDPSLRIDVDNRPVFTEYLEPANRWFHETFPQSAEQVAVAEQAIRMFGVETPAQTLPYRPSHQPVLQPSYQPSYQSSDRNLSQNQHQNTFQTSHRRQHNPHGPQHQQLPAENTNSRTLTQCSNMEAALTYHRMSRTRTEIKGIDQRLQQVSISSDGSTILPLQEESMLPRSSCAKGWKDSGFIRPAEPRDRMLIPQASCRQYKGKYPSPQQTPAAAKEVFESPVKQSRPNEVKRRDAEDLSEEERYFVLYLHLHGIVPKQISKQFLARPFKKPQDWISEAQVHQYLKDGGITRRPLELYDKQSWDKAQSNGRLTRFLNRCVDEVIFHGTYGRWYFNLRSAKTGARMNAEQRRDLMKHRDHYVQLLRAKEEEEQQKSSGGDSRVTSSRSEEYHDHNWNDEKTFLTKTLEKVWKEEIKKIVPNKGHV